MTQSSPDTTELLPCPFCGGLANVYVNEVDFVTKWSVGCGDCNCNMDVCEDTPADAAIEWNTRAPSPSSAGTREAAVGAVQLSYARKDLEPTSHATLELYREDAEHAADAVLAAIGAPAQAVLMSRDKIAAIIQGMCADHVYFDSQEYELMGVGKMSYAVADKLLALPSTVQVCTHPDPLTGLPATVVASRPSWTEARMGYPIGWTECTPSETALSRKSRKSSAEQS